LAGKREGIVTERHVHAALAVRGRFFDHDPVSVGFAPALHEFLEVLVLGASAPQGWRFRSRRRRYNFRSWSRSHTSPCEMRRLARDGRLGPHLFHSLSARRLSEREALAHEGKDALLPSASTLRSNEFPGPEVEVRLRSTSACDGFSHFEADEIICAKRGEPPLKLAGISFAHSEDDPGPGVCDEGGEHLGVPRTELT